MKSKFPPLALVGAIIACVFVLGIAYWTLNSNDREAPAETNIQDDANDPTARPRNDSTQPLAPDSGANATGDGERVALADESALRLLPQVEFELRTSSDRPLSGARAVLFRGEEVFGSRECDAAGVVRFDARDGHAFLIVAARDLPASSRDVPLQAGRHVLVLDRGVAVSGNVRIAEHAALDGVTLVLTSDRPLIDESNWPAAVRRALEIEDRDKLRLVTHTNAAGAFEFTGLGSPWSGQLELGEAHQLLAVAPVAWNPRADSVRLDDPIDGLLLDLAALPLARGRIVLTAGGAGVARASVNGELLFERASGDDEDPSASFDGRAKNDGSFVLPIHRRGGFDAADMAKGLPWPALKGATLTLDGGDNIPRRRLELSGDQLPEGFDFGELVLERGETLRFTAVDATEKPLAAAVGRLDGERSEPTDESGHSSIAYAPGVGRPLVVSLDGYRDGRVDVPLEVSDVLKVVLQRTNRLTVEVHDPTGAPVVAVQVQVSAQYPPGQRPNRRSRNRGNELRTDGQGRATFSDLAAGVPLKVAVRDAMAAVVGEQTLTLEADEWRTIEIAIPRALLAFNGVIRDEVGLPLAEAGIEFTDVQTGDRSSASTQSDADGRFSFSGLTNPIGTLRVRKTGFAPVTIFEFQIPPPGIVADIRMERGLRLTLRVVDERGAPVRGENLRLEVDGERPFQGRRNADNEWEFSNLPRVSMTAIGMVGSREYRQDVEPLNGNQDFRVPVQGGLEVSLRLDPALLQAGLRISLNARDNSRVRLSQGLEPSTFQIRKFEPVLPGEYQLSVAQFSREDPRGNWVNIGAVQRVTISPGAATRLEIER